MDYSVIRNDEYKKIKTPQELLNFMDKYIKYGIYGSDNKIYNKWEANNNSDFQIACQTKYVLCDVTRLLDYGYGTCWDQVELERDWFIKHGYENKTFFIWFYFEENNSYITHTYLVYKDKYNNKYYYFEYSDSANRGIREFNSYKDAINYQMKKHIDFNRNCGNLINSDVLNRLKVYEFNIKKYGCSQNEYIDNILSSKLVYYNKRHIIY